MAALTNRASSARNSGLSDYYVWDEPEQQVSVRLNYQATERMQIGALGGVQGDRDAEIGGILLGRREKGPKRTITVIEDFVLVPCTHESGHVYALTEADIPGLDDAFKRLRVEGNPSGSVVGYFRSHLRNDLFLSAEDLATIEEFFPAPDNVALLIKVLPSRGCTAAFFFWEDGRIQGEFACNEVPLNPVQAPLWNFVERRVSAPAVPAPVVPAVEPLPTKRDRNPWPVVIGLAALSIATGAALYLRKELSPAPATVGRSGSLALHVEPSSDRLTVLWNHSAPEILSADRAVLSIREGTERKALLLETSQLRSGAISYKPEGQDVEFELEVYQGSKGIGKENLHVFLSGSPVVASSDTIPDRQVHEPGLVTAPGRQEKSTVGALPQTQDQSASNSKPLVVKQFSPPQNRPTASSSSAGNGSAPNLPDGVDAPLNPTPTNPVTSVLRFPILPEPPPAKNQQVLTPPATPVPSTSKPYAQAPDPPMKYTAPTVVQRVSPLVPAEIRSHMRSDIEVDVMVVIDMTGQVIDAHVLKSRGDLPALVTPEALRAARQFRFQPAKENERAIRSAMVLSFQFRR